MERKNTRQKEQNNESSDGSKSNENSENGEQSEFGDDHSMWEKAFEKSKNKSQKSKKAKDKKESESQNLEPNESMEIDENSEFMKNREEKIKKFQESKKRTQIRIEKNKLEFSDVGTTRKEIEWQRILEKKLKKTEINWSKRRSIRENNYAYRLEESEEDDEIVTEAILDISGSVDISLLRAFLRQLKPLLKESKLRVGLFNAAFYPFKEIKSVKDIDEFCIPSEAFRTMDYTNLDLAVRSFSKDSDKKINKIIFTDGYGYMPESDLAKEDVIWLVYGNDNFKPCCGKVITISEEQIKDMQEIYTESMKNMKKLKDNEER